MTNPRQTAQDLRDAAQTVTDRGLGRRFYVNLMTGRVCAAGAIGLVTGHFKETVSEKTVLRSTRTAYEDTEATARYSAALTALSPLLPTDCGDTCCQGSSEETARYHFDLAHSTTQTGRDERVFHYNDFMCEGGDELALLLLQAAEKTEADLP